MATTTEPTTQLSTISIATRATGITQLPQTTSMDMSTTSQPLTTAAQHTTTVGELQRTTSGLTATTELTNNEQTTSRIPTIGYTESSTGTGSLTTLNEDPVTSTEGTSESTQQKLSTDDAQQKEEESLSTIVILSVVIALVMGIVVVIVCLVVGRCVCRRLHRKQRRLDLTPLSLNVPDGKYNIPALHMSANLQYFKVHKYIKYCMCLAILTHKEQCNFHLALIQ